MAEFQFKGDGGGGQTPSLPKKKFKLTKKNIVIFGGIGIGLFFLVMALSRRSEGGEQSLSYDDGGPSNLADVAAQLQNYNDNMNAANSSLMSQLESDVAQNNADVLNTLTGVVGEATKDYQEKLDAYNEKFAALESSNKESMDAITQKLVEEQERSAKELAAAKKAAADDLAKYKKEDTEAAKKAAEAAQKKIDAANKKAEEASKAAKKALEKSTVKKAPTKPKAPSKSIGKATSSSVGKAVNKSNLNTKTSVVDYLKASGKNSSFDAREKIAAKQGIKNYKGTAAQNIQMLSTLKKQDSKKATVKKPAAKKAAPAKTPVKKTTPTKKKK